MARRNLKDVKVGDRVWVEDLHKQRSLRRVVKLTPTQIVLENWSGKSTERYQRGKAPSYPHLDPTLTYYRIGSSSWHLEEIQSIATKAECEQWDAEQEIKKQESDAAQRAREQHEATKAELNALFGDNAYVQDSYNNRAGDWQVSVYTDELGVRKLAELLSAPEAGSGDNDDAPEE